MRWEPRFVTLWPQCGQAMERACSCSCNCKNQNSSRRCDSDIAQVAAAPRKSPVARQVALVNSQLRLGVPSLEAVAHDASRHRRARWVDVRSSNLVGNPSDPQAELPIQTVAAPG